MKKLISTSAIVFGVLLCGCAKLQPLASNSTNTTTQTAQQKQSTPSASGSVPAGWEEIKIKTAVGTDIYYVLKNGKSIVPNKSISFLKGTDSLTTYTFDCNRKIKTSYSSYNYDIATNKTGKNGMWDKDEESLNIVTTQLFNMVCKNQTPISSSNPAPLRYAQLVICTDKYGAGNDQPMAEELMQIHLNQGPDIFSRAITSGQYPKFCSAQYSDLPSGAIEKKNPVLVGQRGNTKVFIVKVNSNTTLGVIGK